MIIWYKSNFVYLYFQKNKVCERLDAIWETEGRCEVLYNYYDYLQNEFLSELCENNQLILQHDNEDQELCSFIEAINIFSEGKLEKGKLKINITCGICLNDYSRYKCTTLKGLISYLTHIYLVILHLIFIVKFKLVKSVLTYCFYLFVLWFKTR